MIIFVKGRSQDYFLSNHGERANIVKHSDNLILDGEHHMQKNQVKFLFIIKCHTF